LTKRKLCADAFAAVQTAFHGGVSIGPRSNQRSTQESKLLHYAVVFFVIALVAAVLGFGGLAASAAGIAKALFLVFIVLAVVSLLVGFFRRS